MRLFKILRGLRGIFCSLSDQAADVFYLLLPKDRKTEDFRRSKILAIRLDRIGDLILTTPALRAVKEAYPKAYLAVLVRGYTKDLIEGLSFIDEVIIFERFSKKELMGYLKESHFDVSLGFHPDSFVNYLPWRAGIPFRIGYKFCGSGIFLTQSLPDDRDRRIRHEVASALEIAAKIGARPARMSLSIAVHPESERFAEDFFKGNDLVGKEAVVLHPGARQPYIRWDKKRFAEVADRLVKEARVGVILVGSAQEEGLVKEVKGLMKEECVVAAGLGLGDLVSVIKRARLFIGNSTGPMHIAAALKVPVVAIFGNIHPRDSFQEWGPWGEGHIVVRKDLSCPSCHPGDCRTYACMDAVTVDDVFQAASKILMRPGADHA